MDEYDFSTFAFRSETSLDWEAFDPFLNSDVYNRAIRSKGIVFFANHNPVIINQARGLCEVEELEPPPPILQPDQSRFSAWLVGRTRRFLAVAWFSNYPLRR